MHLNHWNKQSFPIENSMASCFQFSGFSSRDRRKLVFCSTFKVNRADTEGKLFYELGNGEWDIPKLRMLLGKIIPARGEIALVPTR